MKISASWILAMAAMLSLFGGVAAKAEDGMVTAYVVHGIDGDDFGLDPQLPVDVHVGGLGCAIPDLRFADRVGPLEIPAGSYDITISLADPGFPCQGAGVIALDGVVLPAGAPLLSSYIGFNVVGSSNGRILTMPTY